MRFGHFDDHTREYVIGHAAARGDGGLVVDARAVGGVQRTLTRSTTNTSVSPGPITPPAPRCP